MVVGDDQLDTVQSAGLEATQERGPERAVLAVTDVEAQHLAAPVRGDTCGTNDRLGHDAVIDSSLAVGGVEEHVPERLRGQ